HRTWATALSPAHRARPHAGRGRDRSRCFQTNPRTARGGRTRPDADAHPRAAPTRTAHRARRGAATRKAGAGRCVATRGRTAQARAARAQGDVEALALGRRMSTLAEVRLWGR